MADLQLRFRYCRSNPGILKWIQIIFSFVILGLILWEAVKHQNIDKRQLIDGEQYTIAVAAICIFVNTFFLFIFFLNCHNGPFVGCNCHRVTTFYFFLGTFAWVVAAGLEIYATVTLRDQFGNSDTNFHRRAAASAVCFANVLLFLASFQQSRYLDLWKNTPKFVIRQYTKKTKH